MFGLSGWATFGLYAAVVILMPFICWVLWLISGFCMSYFAGSYLDEGDLNYFNIFTDEVAIQINLTAWIFWPIGLPIVCLLTTGFIVYSVSVRMLKSIDSYFGSSTGSVMDFPSLTDRLNSMNKVREKKELDKLKQKK